MKKTVSYFLLLSLIASCSSNEEKKETRTVFKYNEMGSVTSLDPAAASSFENIAIVNQLFNGLVQMNDSLRIEPSIAKAWSISTVELTYTFKLRGDVFFHNNQCFANGK